MKRFQGFILGVIFTLVITLTVPVFADTIEAVFNSINITLNGNKIASVGDSFVLSNGDTVPFSILYKGTTYLPLRKIGEIFDKDISWDDGTKTASVNNKVITQPSPASPPISKIKMYDKHPTVPDFGAFANVEVYLTTDSSYVYKSSSFKPEKMIEYFGLLISLGFEHGTSFKSNDEIVIVHKNDRYTLMSSANLFAAGTSMELAVFSIIIMPN